MTDVEFLLSVLLAVVLSISLFPAEKAQAQENVYFDWQWGFASDEKPIQVEKVGNGFGNRLILCDGNNFCLFLTEFALRGISNLIARNLVWLLVPFHCKSFVLRRQFDDNGSVSEQCTRCKDQRKKTVIYAAKTVKLSQNSLTYNKKVQKLSFIIAFEFDNHFVASDILHPLWIGNRIIRLGFQRLALAPNPFPSSKQTRNIMCVCALIRQSSKKDHPQRSIHNGQRRKA